MDKFSGCMKLAMTMDQHDQDSLLERLDQYQAQGIPAAQAQRMAATDTLAEIQGEQAEFMKMLREQHPDLFTQKQAPGPTTPSKDTKPTPTKPSVSKAEQVIKGRALSPAQRAALQAVTGNADTRGPKERVAGSLAGLRAWFKERFVQQVLDQFAPIKKLSPKAYMLARLSAGSDSALEAMLVYGKVYVNEDGVTDVKMEEGGGGFVRALAKLQGEHQAFFQWVAALRAEKLAELGKENLYKPEHIAALKSLNEGKMRDGSERHVAYTEALNALNEYNDAVLRVAVKSGALNEGLRQYLKDMPYVPFYRALDDDTVLAPNNSSALTGQELWKKITGGTSPLAEDMLNSVLRNWSHVLSASAKNRAAVAVLDEAVEKGYARHATGRGDGAVRVKKDGKDAYYHVDDAPLAEALSAMHYAIPEWMKPMNSFKKALTIGVTSMPGFKIKNLMRDSVASIAVSGLSTNAVANVAQGLKTTDVAGAVNNLLKTLVGKGPQTFAPQNQTYASMLAGGGLMRFGAAMDGDRAHHAERMVRRAGGTLDAKGGRWLLEKMHDALTAYQELGDAGEQANRVALYEQLRAKGHSHAEASFMARDLLDFSMQGKAPIVRFLVHSVPFLNARLQGLYKLASAATSGEKYDAIGLNKRFVDVAAAVSALSLTLMWLGQDDEDWKERPDWDRDSYWWIKIGGTAFRFPKPFEVGAIGTIAERTWEAMFDDEMTAKRYGGRLGDMLLHTFAMDPTPQAFKPLLDVAANKDGFTGQAIESAALEKLRREDRYNERTSMVARWLGEIGLPSPADFAKGRYEGLSPQQIDHLLRGYFGGLATMLTGAVDMVAKPGTRPSATTKQLTSSLVDTLPADQSRYVQALYDRSNEVSQVFASYKDALSRGDSEKALEILAENPGLVGKNRALGDVRERLAAVNRQIKRVDATDMDASEKREKLAELYQRRNSIAKLAERAAAP
jgi:hypothetical protein